MCLKSEIRHHLFLVIKEALHNAIRHASARRIGLSLQVREKRVHISISDDGCGFAPGRDVTAIASSEGHGLGNMRHRVAEIGGKLGIQSSPGSGTTIQVEVPL